jgi:hypothetical protein
MRLPHALCFALLCLRLAASGQPPAEIWRLNQTAQVGGLPTEVLGTPRVVTEPSGPAVWFDGASDGLFVPVNPLAGAPAFTIEVLFHPEEGGLAAQRFFHLQDTKTWRVMIETRLDGQGGWWLDTFLGAHGVSHPLIDPRLVHPTGRWYWVALRYDGKRMTSFVNGVQELEGEAAFGPMTDGRLSLGVRQNKVYWFKGGIREIRWHRTALPATELQRPVR